MNPDQKLLALRAAMAQMGLDALIIPSNDPHQSEYVADHWKCREWISGFTGSAGVAVVTADQAGLWTDSRYYLQAEQELAGSPVQFHRQVMTGSLDHVEWLKTNLPTGATVGIAGQLISIDAETNLRNSLEEHGLILETKHDPLALAWTDRPSLPTAPVFQHDVALAGRSLADKLADIRAEMRKLKVDSHLLVALDDIAWTFNLRGRDVEFNPVFYAFALIEMDAAALFVQSGKIPDAIVSALAAQAISIRNYHDLGMALAALKGSILVDKGLVSSAIARDIQTDCKIVSDLSIPRKLKGCKNEIELEHLRKTMEKDGVALLKLCRWIEAQLAAGHALTEYDISERLVAMRAAQAHYFGESFPAIVGYAGNGAIVHYRPSATDSATLAPSGVLLLDSGGQYLDGTTDITRTFALGQVPEKAILAYTMVLKGHIALANAQFPAKTVGYQLDPLARMHLWSQGMNYGHGTGHGVGFFLNVHEGPQGISSLANPMSRQALLPGMILSNEPGYYESGEWGIRIENLVLCIEADETSSGQFLAFETLSLFPIESTMIDFALLEDREIEWLKAYHEMVWERLSPHIDAADQDWLRSKCEPYF